MILIQRKVYIKLSLNLNDDFGKKIALKREYEKILKKNYWGQHIWSRGYFCATVGAVTEEQVKAYIENQHDESKELQVWDEKLETDLSGD
jgi:REP element-mobilizing transposase RayT